MEKFIAHKVKDFFTQLKILAKIFHAFTPDFTAFTLRRVA